MNAEKIIEQAERIANNTSNGRGNLTEALEFLRIYAGEKSSFYKKLLDINQNLNPLYLQEIIKEYMTGFISYIENGLMDGISIERKVQIDVVSDFLFQANTLLDNKAVHPAAPAVIIGAALEEFLRNWTEEVGLSLGNRKPSIDAFAILLKDKEYITKQDYKDITAWAGIRNNAAHGLFDEVNDRKRIQLMLEGVNLFMRSYTSR